MSATDVCTIGATSQLLRLHITPFNKTICERILPESLRRMSKNISFHQLQTFPERNYGYVDLPRLEAEKLRQKLNGTILKGQKVVIEEARPNMAKRKADAAAIEAEKAERKKARKERRRVEASHGAIEGHQLDADRHVKRGWKEEKKARNTGKTAREDERRSRHENQRLLFKTVVPANATPVADIATNKKAARKDAKKLDKGKQKKAIVVEEFSKSKNTFATGTVGSAAQETVMFEDGKGWVDAEGNVVEAVTSKRQTEGLPGQRQTTISVVNTDGNTVGTDRIAIRNATAEMHVATTMKQSDEVLASSSNDSESVSSHSSSRRSAASLSPASTSSSSEDDISDGSSAVEQSEEDNHEAELFSATTVSDIREVHPLEALYKKTDDADGKLQLAPLQTSFSFFSDPQKATEEDLVEGHAQPLTPRTTNYMDHRRRSAAPTPDTAAIGGRFGFPFGHDEADSEDSEDEEQIGHPATDTTPSAAGDQPEGEESEFRKFFYAKRGESDRAWKKRRRDMKKQQRQRENRRLSRKVV